VSPLSAIYGTVMAVRNRLYDNSLLHARELAGPVVSVGNLSVGGSGKTPFVILLGELLKNRGVPFDVLSRGYGRKTQGPLAVLPNGSPLDFGDEPLLMAQRLQRPVFVGESRHEAGIFAENKFGPQMHLLDDGFQHRSLARDFDIVLVAPEDADDRVMPQGRLREPLDSLRRADAVVVPESMQNDEVAALSKTIWRVRRSVTVLDPPESAVAFCGIARPQRFFDDLRSVGIRVVEQKTYRDHHKYSPADVKDLLSLRDQCGAAGFITTEKDAINLRGMAAELDKLAVARVSMEIVDPADALDTILRVIESRKHQA
jgi:tetraacyldisaccharide 4'-kinase